MKNILKSLFLLLLVIGINGCSKPNTASNKFVGRWHQKGATSSATYDTVIFNNNGTMSVNYDMSMNSYSIISPDTMQINSNIPIYTHQSYYHFFSDRELYIEAVGTFGVGFTSDTLIKD